MAAGQARPRILFLDAYDSFSNNITALLGTLLGAEVFVLPIDSPLLDPSSFSFQRELRNELSHYDAVVCGPGPGSPEKESDVGLMRHVWALSDGDVLPVLGICLGFQSLAINCGAGVRRLRQGLHGMIRSIEHVGQDIFDGVQAFEATLYHSLCVDVGQDEIPASVWATERWKPNRDCRGLQPLAWVMEEREDGKERILMAMKHANKPFWGLQYHPESVCTETAGHAVVRNWFKEAMAWNRQRGRISRTDISGIKAVRAVRPSLLSWPSPNLPADRDDNGWWRDFGKDYCFASSPINTGNARLSPIELTEALEPNAEERIILDSANAIHGKSLHREMSRSDNRYSIVALNVAESLRIRYRAHDRFVTIQLPQQRGQRLGLETIVPFGDGETVWHFLGHFQHERRCQIPGPDVPFLGGFMGYTTYELGLDSIGIDVGSDRGHDRPDLCFVWVTKCLVFDHDDYLGRPRVMHLRPRSGVEDSWIRDTAAKISALAEQKAKEMQHPSLTSREQHLQAQMPLTLTPPLTPDREKTQSRMQISIPDDVAYQAKVRHCQEFIAAGESYELCLTDQTIIASLSSARSSIMAALPWASDSEPQSAGSWQLYKILRESQPAPFASYIRLGGATLVSASPERFLKFDADGRCSMKPMKGTVRKADSVQTITDAEKLLHVPKEMAENLMIVDLVRHDMHGVCGPDQVKVENLMQIEEYTSVFQMTTTVTGQLPVSGNTTGQGERDSRYTGLDVLAASLPPGSMTGAPKKRSCELLRRIEDQRERSLYSGVVGYMDVRGKGDWSVTIRSLFRWDDEIEKVSPDDADQAKEIWHIGAGGAVTILSTPEGETSEMLTKLRGPLSALQACDELAM
jgi:para-aminobenzoate synthetase